MIDDLARSKALATTEVKHGYAGAVAQRSGMKLMLESSEGYVDVLPVPVGLVGMLFFAIPESTCCSCHC
jgi:hypothetical protein